MSRAEYTDVHTSHCCVQHGCKYGRDGECTVVTGKGRQEYPCESCGFLEDRLKGIKESFEFLKHAYEGVLEAQRHRAEDAEKEVKRLEHLMSLCSECNGALK